MIGYNPNSFDNQSTSGYTDSVTASSSPSSGVSDSGDTVPGSGIDKGNIVRRFDFLE